MNTKEEIKEIAFRGHHAIKVNEQYADGLPYNKERVENECMFYMRQSAQAMFEVGKRLILLKENEIHGEFTKSLERIEIEQSLARRIMRATIKLSNRDAKEIQSLPPTKLYYLAMLDDEKLDELEEKGTVDGLRLNAVSRMSTRELRAELRRVKEKREEEKDIHRKMIDEKNNRINALERQSVEKTGAEGWEASAKELMHTMFGSHTETLHQLSRLAELMDKAMELQESPYATAGWDLIEHTKACIDVIQERLNAVAEQSNVSFVEVKPRYFGGSDPAIPYMEALTPEEKDDLNQKKMFEEQD